MAPKKKKAPAGASVTSIQYAAKRKKPPPAGIEAHGAVRETPPVIDPRGNEGPRVLTESGGRA